MSTFFEKIVMNLLCVTEVSRYVEVSLFDM